MCHFFTMSIIFYQIIQLYIQYSSLNLVQTAITTCIFEHILLLRAVVSQRTNSSSQLRIIGSNSTTIAKGTKVLTWIETVTSRITDRTSHTTIGMLATMCLGIVLYKLQIVLLAEFANLIGIGIAAIKVDNGNSFGFRSDSSLHKIIIYLKCIEFRLNKNRFQAILCYSQDGGNIGIGRYYHLITGLHHTHLDICSEYPDESI